MQHLSYQRFWTVADKVSAARHQEGFFHLLPVLRLMEMEQCPLQALLFLGLWNVDFLHGQGIVAGVVHAGGYCTWGWVEVLHLVGDKALLMEELGQLNGGRKVAARVRGDEVWYQILLLADTLVFLFEHGFELLVDLGPRLSHQIQHAGTDVLRRNLELAAYVVLAQLLEEGWVFVGHQVVEPDARLDEHFFDPR